MDIKSLSQYLTKTTSNDVLYNFFRPVVLKPTVTKDSLPSHIVTRDEEMRIDLIFQNIYELQPQEIGIYLEDIDILLSLNEIDNPLNIKAGTIIYYPGEIGLFDNFRINQDENQDVIKSSVAKKLAVPNKSTRKDTSRSKYTENGFSLPPVVQETPRPPVRIENGRFSIGGL
jgi:phage pi2 protein 07